MTPRLSLTVNGQNASRFLAGLVCSNVDPGGFEALTCKARLPAAPGQRVTLRIGPEVAWDGYVNEPAASDRAGRRETTLSCVGYGSTFKRLITRQIYVDRDLTRWGPASLQRKRNLIAALYNLSDPSVEADTATANPSLVTRFTGDWAAAAKGHSQAWYDAQDIPISSLYYAWTTGPNINTTDANWDYSALLASDDVATASDTTGSLRVSGVSTGTGTLTTAGSRFYAVTRLAYLTGPAGTANTAYDIFWTCLAVYGTHGLTKRGSATANLPQGFYPGDIVGDQVGGFGLVADDSSSYIVRQAAYLEPTTREQIMLDMANVMGWHVGTWEPASVLSSQPRVFFTAPPAAVTCLAYRSECDDMQEPSIRGDKLYDTATVGYTDAAGTRRYISTTRPNAIAAEVGWFPGTLTLDMGVGSAADAITLGQFALALSQASVRGAGSCTLPLMVRLPSGGTKPACLLKAGRDRIRIPDLPTIGGVLARDANRYDTFLVRRVETTIDEHGVPRTRVEFDGGADLLDVLTGRLAASTLNL